MLDAELAVLYGVQTKVLVQAFKRNATRFPADFMFQLSAAEFESLRSQFVTSNPKDEGANFPQGLGGGEDIRADDFIEQPGEFAICEADAVQGLEMLAEVGFQGGAVADIRAVLVLEALELADKAILNAFLLKHRRRGSGAYVIRRL